MASIDHCSYLGARYILAVVATVSSVEQGIYRQLLATVPTIELYIYRPVLATVPTKELDIYSPLFPASS